MITPSFAPTATERVLPKLALDFTNAVLDARVSVSRTGNTATAINSSGVIALVNANLPRFNYNPSTLLCQGLLIEESRINILVNSLIDGTNLTTQSVSVSAIPYTLSFYGTGDIVLSGTSSGTVTGTGAYPSRKTYTFTPTAGTLTLTVSGTVQFAQLEAGAFVTSFIPTTTATTRNADIVTMTGTNFSSWWSGNGSITTTVANVTKTSYTTAVVLDNGSGLSGNAVMLQSNSANNKLDTVIYTSGAQTQINDTQSFSTTLTNASMAVNTNYVSYATQGAATTVNTGTLSVPSLNRCVFGYEQRYGNFLNGCIKKFAYYSNVLIANEVQAFSK